MVLVTNLYTILTYTIYYILVVLLYTNLYTILTCTIYSILVVLYTNHDVDLSRGDIRLERQRPVEGVVNVIDSGAYQNFNIMLA